MKLLIFDCETTHKLYYRGSIHQLAAIVVVNDVIQETISLNIRPHELSIIDDEALKVSGVTKEQVMAYPHRSEQFKAFISLLEKYVDPFKADDKFFLLGFNNSWFDNEFLRMFLSFENEQFRSYFFQNTLDAMILASHYLAPIRHTLPSFKLHRVAKTLGITVDDTRLHDAIYDCELTWEIYKIVRGKTILDDNWL